MGHVVKLNYHNETDSVNVTSRNFISKSIRNTAITSVELNYLRVGP